MSELLNQLQPAMRAFFEAFLGHDDRPSLEELREAVGGDLEITVGRHRPYAGPPAYIGGLPFAPRYGIHVEPRLVDFEVVGPQGGADGRSRLLFYQAQPMASASEEEAAGPEATPVVLASRARPFEYSLLRVVERVDALFDDEAEMVRILADMRPPSTWTDPTATAEPGMTQAWAAAVIAQREADAEALRRPLGELEEPPPHMPTRDLDEYRRIMQRYFTHHDGEVGQYYRKRDPSLADAGGVPAVFPEGTTVEYRRINVEEVELTPGTYCLALVPDGWGSGSERRAGRFREVLFELQPAAGGGHSLRTIHWSTRTVRWGDAPARDSYDFCFFIADTTPEQRNAPPPEVVEMGRPR